MTAAPSDASPFTVLVLAGDRGPADPVAQAAGVAHKCLARVGGRSMLERVVEALAASAGVGRIAVSLTTPGLLEQLPALAPLRAGGRLVALAAAGSPARSVLQAAKALDDPFPLLVTTADHALLNPAMVELFCRDTLAAGAAVTAGLTSSAVVRAGYPQTRRTYLAFRDERYSGSNLFALMDPSAMALPELWLRVEQQRKRPWKIAAVFGPRLLLGYLLRRYTLDEAMTRVSTRLGIGVAAVKMPMAEAAIDVDKPADLELVETILAGKA